MHYRIHARESYGAVRRLVRLVFNRLGQNGEEQVGYLNGGISEGRPTRMKKRAKA